jgi:hypothetical protein
MIRVQVRARPARPTVTPLELRTPGGKVMPY